MRNIVTGAHMGTTREPKRIRNVHISTLEDKLRRHKNKARIWRRCVTRLSQLELVAVTYDAASIEVAS